MNKTGLFDILIISALFFHYPAQASDYQITVFKKDKKLIVEKEGQIIKEYHVATGTGGHGTKQRKGDNKTPLGKYHILSFKENSKFDYFIQLDYPNLIDAWYGYKNQVINADEFKRIAMAYKRHQFPPQDTGLGGFIGIHGLGKTNKKKWFIHQELNWTEGCIAVTNEEIHDLKKYVDIGTTVIIRE